MRDEALARIRTAKLRRLEVLEEQIAMVGEAHADPQQLTERDDLKKQLGLADAVLNSGLDDETRRIFRRYDQADLNIAVLSNVVQRVTAIEEWNAVERVKRMIGQRRSILMWIGVMTLVAIDTAAIVWLIVTIRGLM